MPAYSLRAGAAVTCTAGTEKSVLEMATPSTRRCRPLRVIVGGFSVNSADKPMVVSVSQFDTAATGGTATTPNPLDEGEPASLMTGGTYNRTAMPTGTQVILFKAPVPPSGTLIADLAQPDTGELPAVAVSKIVCVSVLAASGGNNQDVHAELIYRE